MIEITPREIAQLTPAEQRQMERWIGDRINLARLRAARKQRRAVRQAIDEVENEDDSLPDMQHHGLDPEDTY